MPMEVSEHQHFTLLNKSVNHLLRVVDRRVQHFGRRFPATVKVAASQGAAIVAVNDAIRVQHRYHLEDKVLA